MSDERFNELVNGPLNHPMFPFKITRLLLALRHVVESCPEAERAFEEACRGREEDDERKARDY